MKKAEPQVGTRALGERLRAARKGLGLTLATVSAATGIGTSSLSEYETGHREPSLHQLRLLSDEYRRPMTALLAEADIVSSDGVLWREKPEMPIAADLAQRFFELRRQFHWVELWCGEESQADLSVETSAPRNYEDAEALADRVRESLGLGDRPGTSLLRVLEEVARTKIFHLDFGESGAAACSVHPQHGSSILLNARHVLWRRNFDAAHELFHLVTWRAYKHDAAGGDRVSGIREEKYATCFARSLLMPRGPFRKAIAREAENGSSREVAALRIAREFEVSVDAVIWARATEKRWTRDRALKLLESCRRLENRMLPRDRGEEPPARPARFVSLVYLALDQGNISLGRAAEFLGVSRGALRKILRADVEA